MQHVCILWTADMQLLVESAAALCPATACIVSHRMHAIWLLLEQPMHAYLFAMLRLHKDTPYVSYLPVACTLSFTTLAAQQSQG